MFHYTDLPGITTKCGNTVYNSDDYYITTVQYILNTNITNFDQYELTCIAQNTAHTIANATATVHIEGTIHNIYIYHSCCYKQLLNMSLLLHYLQH